MSRELTEVGKTSLEQDVADMREVLAAEIPGLTLFEAQRVAAVLARLCFRRVHPAPPSERVPEVLSGDVGALSAAFDDYRRAMDADEWDGVEAVEARILAAVEYCAALNRRPNAP